MKNFILVIAGILSFSLNVCGQDRFPVRQLTFDPAQEGFASWSPDGTKIAFTSTRSGSFDIWLMDINRGQLRSDLEIAQKDGESITLGTYKTIHSRILNEERLLWIHLPEGYEDTGLTYPVLYLLYVDLYNYFADAVSTTEKLGRTREIPPVIVVGVSNTNRYRDLLPFASQWAPEGGGAGDFQQFLGEELIPYIDQNYRTKEFRILAAPQAAAVFSLFSLINGPHLFNATIAQNPFMNRENAEKLYPMAEEFFSSADTLSHFFYVACEKAVISYRTSSMPIRCRIFLITMVSAQRIMASRSIRPNIL